jgi:ketosteroid isomerase-like protein
MRSTLVGASGTIMEIFRVAGGRIAELWGVTSLAERAAGVWTDEHGGPVRGTSPGSPRAGGKTPGTGPRTPSGARQSNTELRATPRQVVEELLRRTADGPAEDMADLFAEDAVFEFPFLPPDASRPEQDRESFRAHLKGAVGVRKFDGMDDVRLHETTDPEVVVTEYLLRGLVLATGERFASRVAMVVRVRNGLISRSRTYST